MDDGPVLVHVVTQKGKGYAPAENSADKYHGVIKFDVATGAQVEAQGQRADLHQRLRRKPDQGSEQGRQDRRHHRGDAVAAPASTCSARLSRTAPSTSASPSSTPSLSPRASPPKATSRSARIYSTFLQRGYDQVVHDVAIQHLPVRFAIDRAGLVGADGPTHAGAFDVAYLGCLPGHRAHGGGRRGRTGAHGGDRRRYRRRPDRAPLSARRRRRRRAARTRRSRWRSARAACCAKGTKVALL